MKARWPHRTTKVPLNTAFAAARRNGWIWKRRAFAKPTSIGWTQHQRKHRHWSWSCRVVERSTTPHWNNARYGGSARRARARPTTSRPRNCLTSKPPFPTMLRSTRRSCRMCYVVWRRRSKPSSAVYRQARHRATRAFRVRAATTASPIPQYGGGAALDGGVLSLSKIGRIPIRLHRPWRERPRPSRSAERPMGGMPAFPARMCQYSPCRPHGQETGIDLGIEAFATLSDGTRIFSPGWYRKAERALKTAHRRVSRRKRGSNRRRKAVTLLAKAHQTVRRQRRDFHHKVALKLVQTHDTIYHENLQPANMVKHHHLAKSISDAGWSAFLIILTYKAACAGRRVVAVNPAYTSQTCSGCGVVVQKGLSVRWHSCPDVRNESASGPQRGEEHRTAWAKPSGRRGVSRVGELRSPFWGACHHSCHVNLASCACDRR